MSGTSGPTVTVQIPSAPLVIGCGLPSSSPLAVTWVALGARYRSVSVLSAPISGETTVGPRAPRPPPAGGAAGGCARAADATSVNASPSPAARRITVTSMGPVQSNKMDPRLGGLCHEHDENVHRVGGCHLFVTSGPRPAGSREPGLES